MISVIEKLNKPTLKVIRKSSELFVNEVPDVFYIGKNKNQKMGPKNELKPEDEIGLPPQPKEYLRCPEYDWF